MPSKCGVGGECWVPWMARRTNKSIIEEVHADRRLSGMVLERVIRYFGHLTRSDTGLEGIIVQGKVEGKRRGRSPATQIKVQLGITLHAATAMARNRPRWWAAFRKTRMAVRMCRKWGSRLLCKEDYDSEEEMYSKLHICRVISLEYKLTLFLNLFQNLNYISNLVILGLRWNLAQL